MTYKEFRWLLWGMYGTDIDIYAYKYIFEDFLKWAGNLDVDEDGMDLAKSYLEHEIDIDEIKEMGRDLEIQETL